MFLAGRRHRGRRHRRRRWRRVRRAIVPDGRTFSYVLHEGDGSGPAPRIAITQNDVRAIQLGQGRAVRRRPAAHGPARDRRGRRDPAGRRVRQPDRPAPRDGPRADPRLRPGARPLGRQRGRDRRADRAAVGAPRGPRSKASSGASRRSRPPSSRASRSTSSRRWRSRTRPPRSRTSPRVVPLPARTATTGAGWSRGRATNDDAGATVAIGTREDA